MPSLRQSGVLVSGAAGVVAALLFSRREGGNLTASAAASPQQVIVENDYPTERRPLRWDSNWDKMAPAVCKEAEEGKEGSAATAEKSTASRTLILIRHGQYIWDPDDPNKRVLTELGKKQAAVTGQRLKQLGHSYSMLHFSTMPRATETAQIIMQSVEGVSTRSCDLMREGAPIRPEPMHKKWRPESYVSHTASFST